jgi:hypothetical protein
MAYKVPPLRFAYDALEKTSQLQSPRRTTNANR